MAAKASISARVDALGEDVDNSVGLLSKQKVEARLMECEKQQLRQVSGAGRGSRDTKKFQFKQEGRKYDPRADFMFGEESKMEVTEGKDVTPGKKRRLETAEFPFDTQAGESGKKKQKKKKRDSEAKEA